MTPPANEDRELSVVIILRIFVPFGLGYFLSYFYRAVNAVISEELTQDIGLTAADLGFLTSTYFLAFALFQLPLGVLLDRYGPRRTEAALLIVAAAGAGLFSIADSVPVLTAGRAFIGLGVSACLMASFKAFVLWFPKERLPLANGIVMTAGGLGAIVATAPVEAALQITDWRIIFGVLAVATLLVSFILYVTVPDKGQTRFGTNWRKEFGGVIQVISSPKFWQIAPITLMSQATFLSIQSLWVGPWLRDVAGMNSGEVAHTLMLTASAMVAGFLILGAAAERAAKYGVQPMAFAIIGMLVFMLVQVGLLLVGIAQTVSANLIIANWALFGFFGTIGIIPYAVLSQTFPPHLAGRVTTAVNFLVFMAAFATQSGVGVIVEMWSLVGEGSYDPKGYSTAFAVLIGLQLLGLVWYMINRGDIVSQKPETGC